MDDVVALANLLREKNALDVRISAVTNRVATAGHTGEYLASRIFSIKLHESAAFKGSDGVFMDGPLQGASVNIKWYGRQESVLDINREGVPDYYLVLCGPWGSAPSRGGHRPWVIDAVYLFDGTSLLAELVSSGVKIGIATGVRKHLWKAAEVYPAPTNPVLKLSIEQQRLLALFRSDEE